jgi:hypothetical protein
LPSSSDGVAVGLATTMGVTACTGDKAISGAAALEAVARNGNNGINRDDGDDGEGAAVSIAAASGTHAPVTTSQQAIISSNPKTSLQAYYEEEEWPMNRALSRGADFLSGQLGEIVTCYQLNKTQLAQQLLNYKKGKYLNTQVSISLNPA